MTTAIVTAKALIDPRYAELRDQRLAATPMDTTTVAAPNHRVRTMLRAVAAGRAEITLSSEPDLYVDGLPCSDQYTARAMAHDGLLRPTRPGIPGQRVPATLTPAGSAMLAAIPAAA